MQKINISDISITLFQKKIKNIHLKVYPKGHPFGQVVVSAPLRMSLRQITKFVSVRVGWIEDKLEKFSGQTYRVKVSKKLLTGEKHYFLGEECLLQVFEVKGAATVFLDEGVLRLNVRKGSTIKSRGKVLDEWYRKELKERIPEFIAEYEPKMKVKVLEFGVKKMKTRWGTCNIRAQRIWLNLELAKKPVRCLEYIVVHEMVHLLERNHTKRFFALMDEFMAGWKECKEILNESKFS